MYLLIMGPPGVGKGTQAANIVKAYQVPHISTGDMFRQAIKNNTPMGLEAKKYMDQGALVPDSVTNGIVQERLLYATDGFLLDGFPRNLNQACALDEILQQLNVQIDAVLNIEGDTDVIIERIAGRRVCPSCGATFHISFNKPLQDNICDVCSGDLIQRRDDTLATAKHRFEVYQSQTKSLLDYYNQKGLVKNINGMQDFEKVFQDIKEVLDNL